MAKAAKINLNLLAAIVSATQTGAAFYVTQDEGLPLLQHHPALIEVNPAMADPNDSSKVAARSTEAGNALIAKKGKSTVNKNTNETPANGFEIIANAALPPSKRGGRGGAPQQYPFDKLEIGQSFFVPVSEKHPDPVKALGSSVSAANHRYAEQTGEMVTKQRTKRGSGNKAVLDDAGNKVKETVTVAKLRHTRKFSMRKVESGKAYGEWTAPADGVLIARTA